MLSVNAILIYLQQLLYEIPVISIGDSHRCCYSGLLKEMLNFWLEVSEKNFPHPRFWSFNPKKLFLMQNEWMNE